MEIKDVNQALLEVTNLSDEISNDIIEPTYNEEEVTEKCQQLSRLCGDAIASMFWLLANDVRYAEEES